MIGLVTHIQVPVLVHIDAIAHSEGRGVARVARCASDASHGGAIGPVSRPSLHSVVGCVENIDEHAGDEDVRR